MKLKYLLLFFIAFFATCKKQSTMEILYGKAAKRLGDKHYAAFKNIPRDSLELYYFSKPDDRAFYFSEDSAFFSEVKAGLMRGGTQEVDDFWCECFFANRFYNYLNHFEMSKDSSLSKCAMAYEKSRTASMIRSLEHVLKNNYIALSNYNRHITGDTIDLTLPVDPINGVNYHVPCDQSNLDSVALIGKLVQKKFISKNTPEYKYYPIEFDMKILETSNANYNKFLGRTFQLNDIITVDLFKYEKIIK